MRSRRLMMSRAALNDLLGIHDYLTDFNPPAAQRFLEELNQKIKWIAQSGATGVPRPFTPGLRAFPYRERCIYFVVSETTMTVLRILHGYQNVSPEDFTESST